MKASGKTISPAPAAAALATSSQVLATVRSRSRKTGVAWTAATVMGSMAGV
jgi:hypothetical protein